MSQNSNTTDFIAAVEDKDHQHAVDELLKLLSFGFRDEAEGKTLSGDQVLKNIRAKYLGK